MNPARLVPVKVALLAFPVFFLGGLLFTLHGGPCAGECHTALFWRAALGGPLALGVLTATLPRVRLAPLHRLRRDKPSTSLLRVSLLDRE